MRSEEQVRRLLRATEMGMKVAFKMGEEMMYSYLQGQQMALKCVLGEIPLPKTCTDSDLDRLEETLVEELRK